MIQPTSAASEQKLEKSRLQKMILDCLADRKEATDKEIEAWITSTYGFTMPASTISGLRNPLVKSEIIELAQKRNCKITGHWAMAWKIKSNLPTAFEQVIPKKDLENNGKLL